MKVTVKIRAFVFSIVTVALGLFFRNLATDICAVVGGAPGYIIFPYILDTLFWLNYVEGLVLMTVSVSLCAVFAMFFCRYRLQRRWLIGCIAAYAVMTIIAFFCPRAQPLGFMSFGPAGFWVHTLYDFILLGTQIVSGTLIGLIWRKVDALYPTREETVRSSSRSKQPYKLGFTLIEVLIVIAIIAVLAAVLFPVLAKSERQGYVTEDISKLRQTYLAVTLYENDHDHASPNTLGELIPTYAPKAILASKLDTRQSQSSSSWPTNVWVSKTLDAEQASMTSPNLISFAYLKPFFHRFTRRQTWEGYRSDPQVGMLVDPSIGECVGTCQFDPATAGQPAYNMNAFFVVRMDGSVTKRLAPSCRGQAGFSYEQMFLFESIGCEQTSSSN